MSFRALSGPAFVLMVCVLCLVCVVVACGGAQQAPATVVALVPAPPTVASSSPTTAPRARPALAPIEGMVSVPAGPFKRGTREDMGLEDEHPQRQIELSAFYIDRTEVTQAAYAECVAKGACDAPECTDRATDYDPKARGQHPVVCVTWEKAKTYCTWAGKRLPTEAEWEKAARGADGKKYPWGDDVPTCERANYYECGKKGTLPVGSLPSGASPFGALDMAGNVWEWVEDWHHGEYYAMSPDTDPKGPVRGT